MKTVENSCQCATETKNGPCNNPNCTCVDCQCGDNCTCDNTI